MPTKKKNASSLKKPQSLLGMADVLPDSELWDFIFRRLQQLGRGFGFQRVETPLLEDYAQYEGYELEQGIVVNFPDQENNRIALRPEELPGLMRAYVEHKVQETHVLSKWYYISPVLAYNEQSKKFITSWEYGFELFGEFTPLMQVQLISLLWKFLKSLGLTDLSLEINSIGTPQCRGDYDEQLRSHLQSKKYELCNECVAAIETKPLRVFRCKNLGCKTVAAEAPQVVDYLDNDCRKAFTHTLEGLDEIGIAYSLNPMLVGREGSSDVIFSVKYKDQQNEYFIGEGARHDEIMENITGKKVSCFGFVGDIEVLRTAIVQINPEMIHDLKAEVFLVPLGDLASKKALRLFSELWDEKISVYGHFSSSGMKNQLKLAETMKAEIALIIGQKEAMDEMVILRDVRSGMQEIFQYERIIEEVKKRLGK